MSPTLLIARKERTALAQDPRTIGWLLAYTVVLSAFAVLLISNQELSLLDDAQVVYMMMGTVTAAGAVVVAIFGADAFAGERERGTLLPLLTAPVDARQVLLGKILGLATAWSVMCLMSLPYLWAVSAGGRNLLQALGCIALFGSPVVLGFGCLAMALSARGGSVLGALVTSLIALLFCASPLLIGPGFRNSVVGIALDAVNPLAGALNTYDSVVIDGEPLTVQLARLALVVAWQGGTFLAARHAARRPRLR